MASNSFGRARLSAAAPQSSELASLARRRFLRQVITGCAAWAGGNLAATAWSAPHPKTSQEEEADTSNEARAAAAADIPYGKLNDAWQRKLSSVVQRASIFRRIPNKIIDCDDQLHLFLVRNPEVIVNIWNVMGVSNMSAERTGAYSWKGNDGAGTTCTVELVYGSRDFHILYGEGQYEGPLFKRQIHGKSVLLLRSAYQRGEDRRCYVDNQLDVFLTMENSGVDLIAKTFHPLVGSTIDSNFAQTTKFLGHVSLTAERNPPGIQRFSDKLTKLQPQVRAGFAAVAGGVNGRVEQAQREAPDENGADSPRQAGLTQNANR